MQDKKEKKTDFKNVCVDRQELPKKINIEVKDSCNPHLKLKDKVKFLLLRKGWTQQKLADEVGRSKATITHILNKDWCPTSQLKIKISSALDCDSLIIWGDENYFLDYQKTIQKIKEDEK